MSTPSYGPKYPSTASILSLIGGVLIALEGILDALRSSVGRIVPRLAGIGIVFGILGLVFGLVILYGAFRLRSDPTMSQTWGILIVVLAVVSILAGGGFLLGLILALIGGILAITWKPPVPAPPGYGASGYGGPPGPPPGAVLGSPGAAPAPPGVAQRFCPACGAPNVATAQFCAKCGAAMPS